MQSSTDLKKSRKSLRKSVHFQGDFPINYLTKDEYLIKKHIPNEIPDDKSNPQPLESLYFQPSATKNPFLQEIPLGNEELINELKEKTQKLEEQKTEIEQAEGFIRDLL